MCRSATVDNAPRAGAIRDTPPNLAVYLTDEVERVLMEVVEEFGAYLDLNSSDELKPEVAEWGRMRLRTHLAELSDADQARLTEFLERQRDALIPTWGVLGARITGALWDTGPGGHAKGFGRHRSGSDGQSRAARWGGAMEDPPPRALPRFPRGRGVPEQCPCDENAVYRRQADDKH